MLLQDNTAHLTSIKPMTTSTQLDENYNADLMDAMADIFEEQQEAMRETEPQEWEGYDDQA